MENDEEIRAHVVSIWRESKKFLSIGGREGMLVLTDKHLSFIHKTTAKIKWWKAITQRQALIFMKSKDTMIHHDGYDEKDLVIDQKNPKNTVLSFNDILNLEFEESVGQWITVFGRIVGDESFTTLDNIANMDTLPSDVPVDWQNTEIISITFEENMMSEENMMK